MSPRASRSNRTVHALPALAGAFDGEKAKRPMYVPSPSRPPEKLGSAENWKRIEIRMAAASFEDRRHTRWALLCWLWYEALVRADLTTEHRTRFGLSLINYRTREHDSILGFDTHSKSPVILTTLPPHMVEIMGVEEILPGQLIQKDEKDSASLNLRLDLSLHTRVALAEVLERIKEAKALRKPARATGSGKQHSLARLVEVLWLHDEKEEQHVKWEAVAWKSKTFPNGSADQIAKLCKRLLTTARLGQTAFVRAFL